jgi:EpsD family peptidyl-prolyl cis-trans isomerase
MRVLGWVFLATACLALASCGGDAAKAPEQVVARIGPDVVTIQELDNEMRLNNVPPERRKDPETVRKLVGDLVARKIQMRRAVTAKLDREPTVLLDLLRARDMVLAQASVSRSIDSRMAAVGPAELEKYIKANPLKFADRQLLHVDQLVVPFASVTQSALEAGRGAKSIGEVAQILAGYSVTVSRASSALNTSELSDEVLSAIRNQGTEGIIFTRAGQNAVFLKVRGQESRPLTGVAAEDVARQLMRADLVRSESAVAAFTGNMEATYVGDYAKIMATK